MSPTIGSRPQPAPKTGQKHPTEAKNGFVGITLARGGVTGRSTPPFPCTLRVPDRFRRVRDPNGTVLTPFGLPAGPAGPGRPGSKNFFGRGSRGSRKKNFPKDFLFKNDIHWVLSGFRAQKTHLGPPWTPQKGPFWPNLHTNWPKWDSKTAKKTHFLRIFFLL